MGEPSGQSGLQRKKPPWLKVDIPTIQLTADDGSPTAQTQPVQRLRSVSMPTEHPHLLVAMGTCSRLPSVTLSVKRGTADWFGVGKDSDSSQRWRRRSLQHCSHLYGGLKAQVTTSHDALSLGSTEAPLTLYLTPPHPAHQHQDLSSTEAPPSMYLTPPHPAYQLRGRQRVVDPLGRRRSFWTEEEGDTLSAPQTPVTPGSASICSCCSSALNRPPPRRKRESVAAMSLKAAAALIKGRTVGDAAGSGRHRRSFMPHSFLEDDSVDFADDLDTSFFSRDGLHDDVSSFADEVFETASGVNVKLPDERELTGSALERSVLERSHLLLPLERGWRKAKDGSLVQPKVRLKQEVVSRAPQRGQRIAVPVRRLFAKDKRPYGLGIVGRLTNRSYRRRIDSDVKRQLQDMDDHRPFFSYWITFVHLLVTALAVAIYGIAPVGFSQHETVDSVLRNKGVYENVRFVQQQNFWIGPSSEALIHLGAKFSPCMRQDEEIRRLMQEKREQERESGCCVRNDRSGCLQTPPEDCSSTLAVWVKWPQDPSAPSLNGTGRRYGAVCHQDPRTCLEPASVSPHEWPDDITRWPICTKYSFGNHTNLPHLDCTITGRPCCIGTKGRCEITSREYCQFMHGYFHEEATLCSQVACMDDVCGLLPFLDPVIPDQVSRLWLSLFLHAGLLHCLVSVIFQMTVLRDLEKLAGWLRISIIYLLSGVTGNLASAIFLPYRAEVGPAGSQFGILACLFVELFQTWQILEKPWRAFSKLLAVSVFFFSFGFLPWIDNFAHVCGFVSGFFLSFAFLPYISFGRSDTFRKRLQVCIFLLVFLGLLSSLAVLFYVFPFKCDWCEYLTCIPITEHFCEKYDLNAHLL